ncbi:MAG: DNA processing protein DprA [Treponematales bacterium]
MANFSLFDLMVCRVPGLSPLERTRLAEAFAGSGGERALQGLSPQDLWGIVGRLTGSTDWAMDEVRAQAERDVAALEMRGMDAVPVTSPLYPPQLREIHDPPFLLFCWGTLPPADRPLAAVVGTRKPDAAALEEAYRVGKELASGGVPVVSGLALGVDAMAHRGCVEGGGATIAVLGSGLDEVYPSANRGLARRVVEGGGCLMSEYPLGTRPFKHHFPARNRIISGLSRGVLVVEAPAASGALITARCALEQGRDLWVGTSGLASPRGEGTRKLAEDGAGTISSGAQILREWNLSGEEKEYGKEEAAAFYTNAGGAAVGSALAESLAQSFHLEI